MNLFNETLSGRKSWERVYQSIPAFSRLAEYVMGSEGLPYAPLANLNAGTNAVFRSGDYVIKFYAPKESGFDEGATFGTELFATRRANALVSASPRIAASGTVDDAYRFNYIITEYIDGELLENAFVTMTYGEKYEIGRRLREITDVLNTRCEPFNAIDIIKDSDRCGFWGRFPEQFRAERLEYINAHDYGEKVFVHGDICMDNVIITANKDLYIIDYADALLAPVCYEHCLMPSAFEFDKGLMCGYFGDYTKDALAEAVFSGVLIQHFGAECIRYYYPDKRVGRYTGLDVLRKAVAEKC